MPPPRTTPEKHYGAAINLYTQALEHQPANAVLYANRAFAHIKIEEYGSAVIDASKAVDADPSYAKVGVGWVLCVHVVCGWRLRPAAQGD
jgi:tetratricopeptide (TPR) repeat protein